MQKMAFFFYDGDDRVVEGKANKHHRIFIMLGCLFRILYFFVESMIIFTLITIQTTSSIM